MVFYSLALALPLVKRYKAVVTLLHKLKLTKEFFFTAALSDRFKFHLFINFLVAFLSAILKMQSLGGYIEVLLPSPQTQFAKRKGFSYL